MSINRSTGLTAGGFTGQSIRPLGYQYPVGLTYNQIIATGNAAILTTGGTQTVVSSNTIHTFSSGGPGTFIPSFNGACELLMLGGGGGGSPTNDAGGGGAGGLIYSSNTYFYRTSSYSIVVGAGGSGASSASGSNTTLQYSPGTTFTALYGGGAGSSGHGKYGGSSGGSGQAPPGSPPAAGQPQQPTPGAPTYTQFGNQGGTGGGTTSGGGAGGSGNTPAQSTPYPSINGQGSNAGIAGGIGLTYAISGASVGYGGGGASMNGNLTIPNSPGSAGPWVNPASGGVPFGGGTSWTGTAPPSINGAAGTGGGGGGNYHTGTPPYPSNGGGNGGSGIVIIKYGTTQQTLTDYWSIN